jgi:hypothetical protein
LFDPARAIASALSIGERPIARERFVIKVIERTELLERLFNDSQRVARSPQVGLDFRFTARPVSEIAQRARQRVFDCGGLIGLNPSFLQGGATCL